MEQEDRDRLIRIETLVVKVSGDFDRHLEDDRDDFREVHKRINRVAAKQNWILGAASVIGAGIGVFTAWVKTTLSGGA